MVELGAIFCCCFSARANSSSTYKDTYTVYLKWHLWCKYGKQYSGNKCFNQGSVCGTHSWRTVRRIDWCLGSQGEHSFDEFEFHWSDLELAFKESTASSKDLSVICRICIWNLFSGRTFIWQEFVVICRIWNFVAFIGIVSHLRIIQPYV